MLRNLVRTLLPSAALVASTAVIAEPILATAKVVILPALDVRQETAIDFGQIRNTSGTCTMGANGVLSGTEGMECTGTETPGTFIVSGSAGNIIDVSVTGGSEDGVFFAPRINGSKQRALGNGMARVTVI